MIGFWLLVKMRFLTELLRTRPYTTNIALGMFVMGVGDIAAQNIENKLMFGQFDKYRSITMISYSGLVIAPLSVFVYSFINKRVVGGSFRQAVKRGVLSNFITNPSGHLMFFTFSTFVENSLKSSKIDLNKSKNEIKSKLKDKYFKTVLYASIFWIPLNILNYWLVPPAQRVICVFLIVSVWNCYLSLIQHQC